MTHAPLNLRLESLRLAVASYGVVSQQGAGQIILDRAASFHAYMTEGQSGSGQPSDNDPGRMPARRRNRQDAGPADRTVDETEIAGEPIGSG